MTTGARLGPAELDAAFPFHFLCDADLRVVSAGSVIRRLLPSLEHTPLLKEVFDPVRLRSDLSFEALAERPRGCHLFRAREKPLLVLRGQMLADRSSGRVLFVGAPRLTVEGMRKLGLELGDFAPHESTADYLFLVQAQQASLAEAARLSDELAKLNGELEARVRQRTSELEAANSQLTRTAADLAEALSALEAANGKLEREMAERVRIEDELRLAHRLEAVGQLAAGIAHEINTPIQYVGDSLFFLKDAFEDALPLLGRLAETAEALRRGGEVALAESLEEAAESADLEFLAEQVPRALARTFEGVDRVATIVRAMKAFAHPGGETKAPADLNAALRNTLTVSCNEYKYVADVEVELGELPPVPCLLGELNQVFLNLVVNAAHAIAAKVEGTDERGTICVRTRQEGGEAVVEIEDTGCGIPAEVRERVFDPFFTTKPVGQGTGQGLTIARNIVVKHGGALAFETEPGRGTKFVIRLPLAEAMHDVDTADPLRR